MAGTFRPGMVRRMHGGEVPSYARRFDGVDDDLRCSIGACNLTGALTIAALARRNTAGEQDPLVCNHDASTSRARLEVKTSNVLGYNTSGSTFTVPVGEWVVLVATKAAGTVAPRFHMRSAGSWTHETSSTTQPNPPTQAGGTVRFAEQSAFFFYSFDIACAAEWNLALSDAQVEELAGGSTQAWYNDSGGVPVGLWDFNQSSTGTSVLDLTGGGADQSLITGTEVLSDGPVDWRYGIS
jgi:hypothetical protein